MKKRKLLNIFILVIICLFAFNIDVKAEEYAECYYNYTPNDSDFKIRKAGFCLFGCEKQATIVLQIAYHKTKYPEPRFAGRLILSSDADFTDGYKKEFSNDIKYQGITCSNTTTLCFVDLPSVNINQIKSNNNKLICPVIYLFKENYQSGKPRYQIGLSPDARTENGDKYDSYEEIEYDQNYSKIKNEDNPSSSESSSEAFSCNYNVNYNTLFQPGGQFGFSVTDEGTVINMFVTGLLGNTRELKYEGSQPLTKCPDYLKLEDKMTATTNYISIKEGTADSYNAAYNGKVSTADDNRNPSSTVISYIEYGNSSKKIVLEKVGENYNVMFKQGSTQNAITISNIGDNDISTRLSSGKNYPNYIIKEEGSNSYKFVDDKGNNKYSEIYININYLSGIQGLGEEQVYNTCRDLFGSNFLTFLEDNVFGVVRIGVIILLILLTTVDFAKVVFIDDKEGIQNAFKNFRRRAIAAVLIFLTPTIIIFIANLVGAGESVQECAKTIRNMSTEVSQTADE